MPEDSLCGREIAGYHVEELLGEGGMGRVYAAVQASLHRKIALKTLHPELVRDPDLRQQFVLEARTAARIDHPNVVAVYDAGEVGELLFLAMKLVRGGSLRRYAEGRRIVAAEAISIGLDIARALEAAWAQGIVHLDVKPDNVLRDGTGRWVVTDFGIARTVARRGSPRRLPSDKNEEPDSGSMLSGTPGYMPQEQWESRTIDGRTDLYALGVTLYRLISGRMPFEVATGAELRQWYVALTTRSPIPLAPIAPDAPPALISLVERLLARKPDDRPASAAAVVAELEALQRPPAPPPPAPEATGARRPTLVLGARPAEALRPPLLERAADLDALAGAIERARETGRGEAIALVGPRGSGRTRLLDELAREVAPAHGARALTGGATRLQPLTVPWEILRRACGIEAADEPDEARGRLRHAIALAVGTEGYAELLAVVEPWLLAIDIAPPPGRAVAPASLARIAVAGASAARPIVLAIDDLDEADGATIEFVEALAEETRARPVVLVVAARADAGGEATLARIGARTPLSRRPTERLSEQATPLVASCFLLGRVDAEAPRSLVRAVSGAAQGLPGVVQEASERGLREGVVRRLAGTAVGDAVALGRIAREAAERKGSRTDTPVLGRFSVAERVEEVERRLAMGLCLRAFHDMPGARRELEAAAATLGEGVPPLRAAVVLRELARTDREVGEHLDQAAGHALTAFKLAHDAGDPLEAAEAAIEAALARYRARRYEEALAACDMASAELTAAGSGGAPASLEANRARRLGVEELHVRGLIASRIGPTSSHGGHPRNAPGLPSAEALLSRALRMAAPLGDQWLYARIAQSFAEVGMAAKAPDAEARRRNLAAAARLLQVSAEYKERIGDRIGLAIAYGGLGRHARACGDEAGALEWFERDIVLSRRLGDSRGTSLAANAIGELRELAYLKTADPRDLLAAEASFAEAREAAARTGNEVDLAIARYYLGRFLVRTKGGADFARGKAELESARATLAGLGRPEMVEKVDAELERAREIEEGGEAQK